MARKGEKLDPELAARMAEGRRLAREQKQREVEAALEEREDVSLELGYGSAAETEVAVNPSLTVADPADPPYAMWLMALEPDTREMFTEAELKATFAEVWEKAKAEKRNRRKKEIADLALSTSRSSLGLLPAQTAEALRVTRQNARPVSMMIELPPAQADGQPADIGLRVNGQVIPHGRRHYCTYGEAASLREMLYRAGQHELIFKGEGIRYRSWMMGRAMGSVNTQIDAAGRGGDR
jgi:hypothetical protein